MFQVKVIKERQNVGIKERLAREQQQREEEARELAARQAVVHILMDHGVTQAKGKQSSDAAGK